RPVNHRPHSAAGVPRVPAVRVGHVRLAVRAAVGRTVGVVDPVAVLVDLDVRVETIGFGEALVDALLRLLGLLLVRPGLVLEALGLEAGLLGVGLGAQSVGLATLGVDARRPGLGADLIGLEAALPVVLLLAL